MSNRGGGASELIELVGRRVALRHRLPTPDGRALFTDAVGELADDGPLAVLVHTRRGVVRVRRDAVVAVREIPPPRTRRPSWAAVARLEHICADAWPAVVERPLGQWRLRAAGGFSGRANAALVLGDPGCPLSDALDEVRRFAAEHGLPPKVQVPRDSPWHRTVLAYGWRTDDTHPAGADVAVLVHELPELTQPAELADPAEATERLPDGLRLTIDEQPDPDWWRLIAGHPVTGAQRHVLTAPGLSHRGFGVARISGPVDGDPGEDTVIGAMRIVVLDGHLYVARLTVMPEYRRRGVAVALMGAAARWASARSARWCVLQVAEHNTAALALYRRLGFRKHHVFQFLRPA